MTTAPTRPAPPQGRPAAVPPVGRQTGRQQPPAGAARWSKMWLDDNGHPHTSDTAVPVNDQDRRTGHVRHLCAKGQIEVQINGGPDWEKRPCDYEKWVLPGDKPGFCPDHGREELTADADARPDVLGLLAAASEVSFRPWWVLAAEVAAGIGLHAADVAPWWPAAAVPVAAGVAWWATRATFTRAAVKAGRIDKGQTRGRRVRRIARRARTAGWLAAAGSGWLAAATVVDPTTAAGKAVWVSLPVAWAAGAVPWWRHLERRRNTTPPPPPEPAAESMPVERELSDDEKAALAAAQAWTAEVAAADTALDPATWRRIPCGWQAVVKATKRGALVRLANGGDMRAFTARVAAAYDVPRSAVTWVDEHDENPNLAMLYVQPVNPLRDGQIWAGPQSVTIGESRIEAEVGQRIDGTAMREVLFRFDEGVPSELVLGSTGSGKSERLRLKLIIQRWASYLDAQQQRRGLYLSLLHDPKRLNSYGEFRDALHGYGMTRDDAHIMIDAMLREMIRRYDMLSATVWIDGKKRRRRGAVKFNPLVHGPLIHIIWDEFHELAGDKAFVEKIEKLARYQRACGMGATLASHMGTLGDTGSQALRDMLAGGRASLLRTTSGLNAALATGGQLTQDPRALPKIAGMALVADGESQTVMGRYAYIPDDKAAERLGERSLYDWLFDDENQPIGYPADIPAETAEAFGPEFMEWMAAGRSERGRDGWVYAATPPLVPTEDRLASDRLLEILVRADRPLTRKEIKADPLWVNPASGKPMSISSTMTAAIKVHEAWIVKDASGDEMTYALSDVARAELAARAAESAEVDAEAADESVEVAA